MLTLLILAGVGALLWALVIKKDQDQQPPAQS